LLVEASAVYQAAYDLPECLEVEVEQSGCNAAEIRDQKQYETDWEARRLFARQDSRSRTGI
jgi:hypothetical protein